MPFTFAHPAIVLPLNYISRQWVSITALIVGSMTPDFEYFMRMRILSRYSHSWSGLFWFDLPLGLLIFWIYESLVKRDLIGHLPAFLNKRFSDLDTPIKTSTKYRFLVVTLSIFIGATSHLLWDGFTHRSGTFVKMIPALSKLIYLNGYSFYLYNLIQHFSTVIGLTIIIVAVLRLPKKRGTQTGHITFFWLVIVACGVLAIMIRLLAGLTLHSYGDIIVSGISGMIIGLILSSVLTYKKILK